MLDLKRLPAGLTNEKELQWLYDKVLSLPKDAVIVELGSWLGRSAVVLAQALINKKDLDGIIFCIDTWYNEFAKKQGIKEDPFEIFKRNVFPYPLISYSLCRSWEAAEKVDNDIVDMIFIDASHEYEDVAKDLQDWYPKMKKGAVFCGHDFRKGNDVERAVREFAKKHNKKIRVMRGGTIWEMV